MYHPCLDPQSPPLPLPDDLNPSDNYTPCAPKRLALSLRTLATSLTGQNGQTPVRHASQMGAREGRLG